MAQKTIITHDGAFHADDVFAVAALRLREPTAAVIRTRDSGVIAVADFVVDVGAVYNSERNRFDHHQLEGAGARENGIPFAAFGLVWKKFGAEIAGSADAAARIDTTLAATIDANDNGISLFSGAVAGVYPYELSNAVSVFTPTWDETPDLDRRFFEVVEVAKEILTREIIRARAALRAKQLVISTYHHASDKRLIILDENYPWRESLAQFPEPLYVAHPQDGKWYVECVRDNPDLFANRKDMPESWAGLRDEALSRVTGVSDAIFCHRNRFMAAAKTKEGAVALAKLALSS